MSAAFKPASELPVCSLRVPGRVRRGPGRVRGRAVKSVTVACVLELTQTLVSPESPGHHDDPGPGPGLVMFIRLGVRRDSESARAG
jgi:hypothetical protein